MPAKRKQKSKQKKGFPVEGLCVTMQDHVEADTFLRRQAEQIAGCSLYPSYVAEEDRIPDLQPATREEWSKMMSKCMRLYGNYLQPAKKPDASDMTAKSIAVSTLASKQFIKMMERLDAKEFDFYEEEEEETFPEYR